MIVCLNYEYGYSFPMRDCFWICDTTAEYGIKDSGYSTRRVGNLGSNQTDNLSMFGSQKVGNSAISRYELQWCIIHVPVVPHKAVAEVSEQETYRRGWLLWITDGRGNPLFDRKVVGVVFVGVVAMVAVVTSPKAAGLSVV